MQDMFNNKYLPCWSEPGDCVFCRVFAKKQFHPLSKKTLQKTPLALQQSGEVDSRDKFPVIKSQKCISNSSHFKIAIK